MTRLPRPRARLIERDIALGVASTDITMVVGARKLLCRPTAHQYVRAKYTAAAIVAATAATASRKLARQSAKARPATGTCRPETHATEHALPALISASGPRGLHFRRTGNRQHVLLKLAVLRERVTSPDGLLSVLAQQSCLDSSEVSAKTMW